MRRLILAVALLFSTGAFAVQVPNPINAVPSFTGGALCANANSQQARACVPNIDYQGPPTATTHGDSDYTILSTDSYVYPNALLTAARTWTLPAASSFAAGQSVVVADPKNEINGANTLTVKAAGSDLIERQTTVLLDHPGDFVKLTSDGVSTWSTNGRYSVVKDATRLGAYPDDVVKSATGVSISSGSPNLTCGNCAFTAADAPGPDGIKKIIRVHGAGASGATLKAHIASVTDATHVVLDTNAATTLSSASVTIEYGTDTAAKIQPYLNQFTTFAGPGPAIFFPGPGTYLIEGLSLPKSPIVFYCEGPGTVTLKLADAANTYMWADESYLNSLATGDNTFRIRGCTIDGNNTNQTGSTALAIHHREVWYENNILQNSIGAAVYIPAKGADGTTCGSIGNSKFFNNKFQNNSGQGVLSLDGGCIGIADQWYSGNTFNANTLSCDAGAQNYAIYTDRASGFTIIRNRFFGQAGCGDIHLDGSTASVLVEGNTFDGNANTANGANPIKGVWIDTGTGSQWSGATVTGNVFKYTNSALPGSATEMRLVEYDNDATGSPPGCVCGGNTFFSVNLAGVKSIVYGGSHVGDLHLNAKGNTYGANAAEPTDTNIDTKVLLANANLSDLPSVNTALANLNIENGVGNGDSDITIACTTSEEHTFAAFTTAHTWTLPSISSCGFNSGHRIVVTDTQATVTSTNTLTIAPNTGDTIVGATADKTINESRGEIRCIVTKSLIWKCTLRQSAARLATTGVVQPSNNGSEFTNMATFRANTGTNNASNLTTGTVAAAQGGAGTVNGILKANGSGAVSQAISSTDYAPATSGSSILKGNGTGGFSSAVSGTDYAPPVPGTSGQVPTSDGAGGFSTALGIGSGFQIVSGSLEPVSGNIRTLTASSSLSLSNTDCGSYVVAGTSVQSRIIFPASPLAGCSFTIEPWTNGAIVDSNGVVMNLPGWAAANITSIAISYSTENNYIAFTYNGTFWNASSRSGMIYETITPADAPRIAHGQVYFDYDSANSRFRLCQKNGPGGVLINDKPHQIPSGCLYFGAAGTVSNNTNYFYVERQPTVTVTGAVNNGSGAIRLTITTGLNTGDQAAFYCNSVGGTYEADGIWVGTIVSSTQVDLVGSTFTHTYTSGGQCRIVDLTASTGGHTNVNGVEVNTLAHSKTLVGIASIGASNAVNWAFSWFNPIVMTDTGASFATPPALPAGVNNAAQFGPTGKLDILTADVAGTLTGTDETLHSYSLPANTLDAVGREITVQACWLKAANSNSVTHKLSFGTNSMVGTTTSSGIVSCLNLDVIKTGSNAQKIVKIGQNGTAQINPTQANATETDTSAITIKATTNETVAGDETLVSFVVRYWN